ncbi:MAG: hypothetical protein EKK59_10380 [Neisseriaceae bacterium]|nr:MAG: hypothetical protein EKK59_10380 [Neisseriaceae bacterium]
MRIEARHITICGVTHEQFAVTDEAGNTLIVTPSYRLAVEAITFYRRFWIGVVYLGLAIVAAAISGLVR